VSSISSGSCSSKSASTAGTAQGRATEEIALFHQRAEMRIDPPLYVEARKIVARRHRKTGEIGGGGQQARLALVQVFREPGAE